MSSIHLWDLCHGLLYNLDNAAFLVEEGREAPHTTIYGPSLARQRNAILMAFSWRANDGQPLIFRGSGPVLLGNLIFCDFLGGGGVQTSCPPPPPPPHPLELSQDLRMHYLIFQIQHSATSTPYVQNRLYQHD